MLDNFQVLLTWGNSAIIGICRGLVIGVWSWEIICMFSITLKHLALIIRPIHYLKYKNKTDKEI